jgi:CBS domain-containing protein
MEVVTMYSIRQFLDEKGRDVWSVKADAPVFDALKRMAEKNCGALVVLDDNDRLVGVVSERDYARKVVLLQKTSIDTPVSEIMTANVVTVGQSETLDHCLGLMTRHNVRHLPVVSGTKVEGVLGIGELVEYKMAQKDGEIQTLTKYVSGELAYR